MTKLCMFDLDGTLTDTLESLAYSVDQTLKEMGLSEITKEQLKSFVGNGARYLIDRSIRAAGDEDGERLDEAMEIYGRIFDENCTYHVTPYNGIADMLSELRRRGIRLAVLSNKPHRQAVKVVRTIFGRDAFDVVQGQQAGIARKPAPDVIYAALDRLSVSKEECLYAGDSEVDIATGRNAGVKTVSVAWGFRTEEELRESGAALLIHEPGELIGCLK